MRIREAYENFLETLLCKVLAKMAHGVRPYNPNMIKFLWLLDSVASDLLGHKIYQFISDLETQQQFVRQNLSQAEQQSSISTANIYYSDVFVIEGVVSWGLVKGGVFDSIAIGSVVFFQCSSEVQRVVSFPINKGMMRRKRERCGIERIDVRSHSVVFLFGYVGLCFDYFAIAFIVVRLLAVLLFSLHKRNIIINFSCRKIIRLIIRVFSAQIKVHRTNNSRYRYELKQG